MRPLFARYPQLETLAFSRNGDQITFLTTGGGCVMLDTDNFCRIEKELGKDKKPNICNLFPFNMFTRIGKTIVVTPHFLCPLRAVVPPRPGGVLGTHALIEADIRKSQMLSRDYIKSMVIVTRPHVSVDDDAAIACERAFRDLCSSALGRERFTDVLMIASADPAGLSAFAERAQQIIGYEAVPRRAVRDDLDDLLLAFASPYRIGLLGLRTEGILRALVVAEMIARRAWSGATMKPTFQALANTVANMRSIQFLLAWGEEQFDFGKVARKSFAFRDSELTFAAFIAVNNAVTRGLLDALAEAIPPAMSIADRSVLLTRLGELMQSTQAKRKRKHGVAVERILASQEEGHDAQQVPSLAATI